MRIQWSSSAAQEMLGRLDRVNRSMEDCLRQSAQVRAALAEANTDGANRALRAAQDRYGLLAKRLTAFEEALEAFRNGVRRANDVFEDAEAELGRSAEGLGSAHGVPTNAVIVGEQYIRWEPAAYVVMPKMRIDIANVPEWLRKATAETGAIPHME